ncbi:Fic family protein [Dactylosporangium sucinum]|uniref:Cell division protein Fic n=1 Tax=Dactylosporangium sucinum TaxID=1424081 RepID=A0A917WNA2_9ACTN|nr:Fic family protein [Dactylosporangium sucinum]GGM16764.1 cell division protein Fic [Dactylosporangium sucinum]
MYQRLDEAVAELRDRLGGLPSPAEAEDIWSDIWHQEAHNSTAIEGNTLVLQEVEKLLEEGRAVGAKPLSEYMEVKGYGDAAKWVYGQALDPGGWQSGDLVSLQEVRQVHFTAMTPVWTIAPHPHASAAESPGNFRQHEIAKFPGGMKPPTWADVDSHMRSWIDMVNDLRLDSVAAWPERLAGVHNRFEQVHPFLDGNGRAGRLLLNLILCRLGYPPAIIYKRDRDKYLRAMRRADAGEPGPLGELIARSVTTNLYRFVMPAVAGPVKLLPLPALATSDLSENALRTAAVRGRLRAIKSDDGSWRSSKKWVADYIESKHRRS